MRIEDADRTIAAGDQAEMAIIFRAIVDWPNSGAIAGRDSAPLTISDLMSALEAASRALIGNDAQMPEETADAIRARASLEGQTYGDGARAVLSRLEEWRAAFRASLATIEEGGLGLTMPDTDPARPSAQAIQDLIADRDRWRDRAEQAEAELHSIKGA